MILTRRPWPLHGRELAPAVRDRLDRGLVATVFIVANAALLATAPVHGDFWWSDAPRHALNGAFVKDFIAALPWHYSKSLGNQLLPAISVPVDIVLSAIILLYRTPHAEQSFPIQSLRRLRFCRVLGGAKSAALIMLGDRLGARRLGRQYRLGIRLGVVLRPVAEAMSVRVVVP